MSRAYDRQGARDVNGQIDVDTFMQKTFWRHLECTRGMTIHSTQVVAQAAGALAEHDWLSIRCDYATVTPCYLPSLPDPHYSRVRQSQDI
jgi:hypothetical protein